MPWTTRRENRENLRSRAGGGQKYTREPSGFSPCVHLPKICLQFGFREENPQVHSISHSLSHQQVNKMPCGHMAVVVKNRVTISKMGCPGKWSTDMDENLRSDSWWFNFDPCPCLARVSQRYLSRPSLTDSNCLFASLEPTQKDP